MKRTIFVCVAAAATLFSFGSAFAAATVIGTGAAQVCYQAAMAERRDTSSLRTCNDAIDDDQMSVGDRAATQVNRGIIRVNRQEYAQALADFDSAIRLRPQLGEAYVNRGATLVYLEDYSAAVQALSRGIDLASDEMHKAYFNRALAHEELGDLRAAYADYRRAAELAPAWELPRTELARYTVRQR